MVAVKGSTQHEMVVVRHRPVYKTFIGLLIIGIMASTSYLTYRFGHQQGLALQQTVVRERDETRRRLELSERRVAELRQQVADLKLGGVVDSHATEEVRQTVGELQDTIAALGEEIRFYKGVMLPNVGDKGLRIERLDVKATPEANRVKYALLLTQVVDKHDFVSGGVEFALRGVQGTDEKTLSLNDLVADPDQAMRFRFRYFQNFNGEMVIPQGFEPRELLVTASSSGRNPQRLERAFDWAPSGG